MAVKRELLQDGSVRLSAGECTFVFTRLRPGVLLVTVWGYDRGELGTAPLDEFAAEIARFRLPLELFVDTREATNAATTVSEQWAAWFQENRQSLKKIDVLAVTRPMELTVAVARHFSRTGQLLELYSEVSAFEAAIRRSVPGFRGLPDGSLRNAPPSPVRRERAADGSVVWHSPACRYHFRILRPTVLLLSLSGQDSGELGTGLLDEMTAYLSRAGEPVELFFDTADVTGVGPLVTEEWTAWLQAHRPSLRAVHMVAASKLFHLTFAIARERSAIAGVTRIHQTRAEFEDALRRLVPHFSGLAAGG